MGQALGAGRPAKPDGAAVNRNKPTHGEVLLPAAGRTKPAPEPMTPLTEPALSLWNRLWATPEATQWGEADVPGLTHYVNLAVVPEVWLDSKSLAELRNLSDRFGMNPYSRRVSKWVHEEPEEPTEKPATAPKSRSRKLRVVDMKAG